jgi:uncharacterized protein YegP (UPF0339 family)
MQAEESLSLIGNAARGGETLYFAIVPASGGYRAHAYGSNNELVWWTEVYVTKAGARNAIAMLQVGAATAPVYDRA